MAFGVDGRFAWALCAGNSNGDQEMTYPWTIDRPFTLVPPTAEQKREISEHGARVRAGLAVPEPHDWAEPVKDRIEFHKFQANECFRAGVYHVRQAFELEIVFSINYA